MEIDRRTLLQWALPSVSAAFLGSPLPGQPAPAPLFVLIDGIGGQTTPEALEFVLEPLLVANIPVALVLSIADGADGGISEGAGDLVRHLVTKFPDLLEPVPEVPGLVGLSPYFQRRAASDALAGLHRFLARGQGAGRLPPAPLSITTPGTGEVNLDALRGLGIRQVIDTSPAGFATATGCARRMICMSGALRLDLASQSDAEGWIARTLAKPDWAALVIGVSGIGGIALQDLRRRSETVVAAIATEVQAGRRFVVLPREQIGWFAETQARQVALRLARPTPADQAAAAFAEMRAALGARGFRFSVAGRPWDAAAAEDCLDLGLAAMPDALGWIRETDGARPVCALGGDAGALPPELATGIDLLLQDDGWPAFTGDGSLRVGELRLSGGGAALEAARLRDTVIAIDAAAYATAESRQDSLDLLERLRAETGTVVADLAAYAAAVSEPDRLFTFLRETYREPPADPADPADLSHDELLADARLAWRFFERFSYASNGLCTATAHQTDGDIYLHQELTMWDLGSLLAAIMAVHELGIVGDAEFVARIGQVVTAIPSARFGSARLPAAVVATRTSMALSQDFNACDTGRLLSVLRELEAHPLTRGIAAEALKRWDFNTVIAEGRVHSVVNGRLVDQSETHCSHYTARAFRAWGFDALSPYEVAPDGSETDRRMRLLERVRGIGPFGAEPLLLEAVEMPFSAPAAFLADLLLGQQRRGFERTGELLSVSEAPLDREPWFTYQGISLATPDHPWVVKTVDGSNQWQDEAFWREVLLVNTKAAYLWAAMRPGAFSFHLARHVRDRARIEDAGFSPGVFSATGTAMKGYVDVNTNGIILQAIAYILRGRRPRFT